MAGFVAVMDAEKSRRHRWLPYAVAGLLVGGAAGAVTVSLVVGRGPAARHVSTVAAVVPGGCTEQVTLTAPDGRVSGCVSYLCAHGDIEVRAVAASFTSPSGQTAPWFTFAFRSPATGKVDYQFATSKVQASAVRSDSTGPIMLGSSHGRRDVRPGELLDITVHAEDTITARYYAVATVSLSLNRHGLRCPMLGQSWSGSIPAC